MPVNLEILLVEARKGRFLLFASPESLRQTEGEQTDKVHRGIAWIESRSNRLVRWFGRVFRTAYTYYQKLEDRIDPVERVLKALADASHIRIRHSAERDPSEAERALRRLLQRQRTKHLVWSWIDGVVGAGLLTLSPIIGPIPGPNVFLYYPSLRFLSHYRAWVGSRRALAARWSIEPLPQLLEVEAEIRRPVLDRSRLRRTADRLGIEGLGLFLERMV